MKPRTRWLTWLACLLIPVATGVVAAPSANAQETEAEVDHEAAVVEQARLEKEFSEKLSGSVLVGQFTIAGQKSDKPPREERYELESVTKVKGSEDTWRFVARIKYGDNDVPVTLRLKVLWAGDTPMITITDYGVPGLGTFTARVMFYGDRYAGTWQHGDVGGHMFGVIEKAEKPAEESSDEG